MHRLTLISFSVFALLPGSVFAANQSIRADKPLNQSSSLQKSNIASPSKDGFIFSGYVEPSYNYLLRANHFTSGFKNRVFDLEPQGFTLQQAAITLAKQPSQGWGGLLNLILGRDANTLSPAGINPRYFGIQNIGLTPTQAFLQYRLNQLTLLGGKYNCSMGAENYNPTVDSNFSRSIVDGYAQPSTFIGIEGKYIVNNKLSLSADVNNGWDTIQYTGRGKTLEANATYTPLSNLALSLTGITGVQPSTDGASFGPTGRRTALDFIGTFHATDQLTFVTNYDYGMQTKATLPSGALGAAYWQGIALYLNYKHNDKWKTSLRGEIFSDRSGYRTGVPQNWKELTLTVAYLLLKNFQIRAETRHDFSNVKSFSMQNGQGANTNQQSYALEGLYQF
jgi:hypothetical protein